MTDRENEIVMTAIDLTIPLPRPVPPVLAVGAFLKNTVCVVKGDRAYQSPPVGNLDSREAIDRFEASIAALLAELEVTPRLVAHDLHPDFHSTRWAQASGIPALPVQHHHAHIAALAAEHGVVEPLLGLSLDGFGLGPGNQSWGGELLMVDGPRYQRVGHLAELLQPGGDIAAREPWRMAAAVLHRLGRGGEVADRFTGQKAARMLGQVMGKGINCPPTSSCGRLFDAACGLLGVYPVAEFEGQAPMALEKMVTSPRIMADGWTLDSGVLDLLPLLERLGTMAAAEGADLFHGTLIAAFADWAEDAARQTGVRIVGLGGGCFFNRVLTAGLVAELERRGLRPLTARQVSPGDPGLSLGQAWIAAQAAGS
jgi:hydrogenase maturation protein HypF